MVDFRKAFDLVDHNLLLQKLRLYKCDENSLSWFYSYLSNSTQMVSINNKILAPLMFLIFINDLSLVLENTISSTGVGLQSERSGVRNLPPPCCVLEQDTLLPESTGLLPRKRWLCPDMTEKLLTGTLSLNTNKQTSTDLYADDTTVYNIQTNMQTLERNLQNSLFFFAK